ncbi:MAG: YidC/Oxa1 family membrane protein insertase, partial [Chloroflexota bacterium]
MIELWNALLFQPMLNLLVIFYTVLFHNFGVAIIGFTILIRLLTWPLTRRQWESTKKMSALQPRMQELQKKYARDKRRLGEEQMKL